MNEEDRAETLADLLLLMEAARPKYKRSQKLRPFRRVELLGMIPDPYDGYGYFQDVNPTELERRLDVSVMVPAAGGPTISELVRGQPEDLAFHIHHVFKDNPKKIRMRPSFIASAETAEFNGDGQYVTLLPNQRDIFGFGSRWFPIESTHTGGSRGSVPGFVDLAPGIQLTQECEWGAEVMCDRHSIWLPTPVSSLAAMFKSRDVPAGKTRRSALRHWVAEHTRRNRSAKNPDDVHRVRRHLRGSNMFEWFGFKCFLHIPFGELRGAGYEQQPDGDWALGAGVAGE